MFVVHHVPEFDVYLKQFEGNLEARKKAGVTRVIVARLSDDPHRVALHFSAGSLESVEAFLKSSEYQALVDRDQATDSSLLWVAEDELNELPSELSPGSVSLFKKFPADVTCVGSKLIEAQAALRAQGVLGYSLHRTSANAGFAILHLLAESRPAAEKAFGGEPLTGLLAGCGAPPLDKPILADNQLDEATQ